MDRDIGSTSENNNAREADRGASDAGFVGTPTRPATDSATSIRMQRDRIFADIGVRFTYHTPKGDQPDRYERLRATARELAYTIGELTPVSREQALALTNLEQAIFWANAAIARNE